MTQNTIAYGNMLINADHYERQDAETKRHNLATENLSWFSEYEKRRHNTATEAETNRSNLVKEDQSWFGLYETNRANQANESIGWFNAYEKKRSNEVNEGIANESLIWKKEHEGAMEEYYFGSLAQKEKDREFSYDKLAADTTMRGYEYNLDALYKQSSILIDTARAMSDIDVNQSKIMKNYSSSFNDITKGIGEVVDATSSLSNLFG